MRPFARPLRNATAFVLLVALLVTHSALAVAACLGHLHESGTPAVAQVSDAATIVHAHAAHAHHDHAYVHPADATARAHDAAHSIDGPAGSPLCQLGCDAQAPSLNPAQAAAVPAPVAQSFLAISPSQGPALRPIRYAERAVPYATAAPPPLPLTIVLSRFRN